MPRAARVGVLSLRAGGWWPASILPVLPLLLCAATPALAAPDTGAPAGAACGLSSGQACLYAGRPLVDALNDLRGRGLNLIFSSDLVRPDLIVAAEPPAAPLRQTLDRLLSPFGLEARAGPSGTILIVRGTGQDPPVQSRPILRERLRVESAGRGEVEPMQSLRRDDLERLPTMGDDPTRTLATLPGITASDRSANFSVRGGEPGEARVVLDGLDIDEPFHLKDFAAFSSIVDAATVDRVDVLTGLFPVEYGDVAGGVIDLSTIDTADTGRTIAGISTINAGFLSGGRLGTRDGSWLVSARSWRPDALVDSVAIGGDGINPAYNDLLGKLQFRLPGGSLLSAHLLASQDTLAYRNDSGDSRVAAADEHRYAWVNWKMPWSPRLYSHTVLSSARVSRARHGAATGALNATTQVDDARSYGSFALKQDWIFEAGERSLLKWGFDLRHLEAEYAYRSHVERVDPFAATDPGAVAVVDRDLLLDPAGDERGLYLAGRLRVAAPLTVEAGVRRDRLGLTSETLTSPRVNIAWSLGERTTVKSGWGRFYQPQGIHELPIEDGVVDFFPAPRAEQRQIDFDHLFRNGLRLNLSIYDTHIARPRPRFENLFDPFQLFPESEPDRTRIDPARARVRGIELGLAGDRRHGLAWRASYALASAEDEIAGAWVPRSWDQRHTLNFNLDFRPREHWEVSLTGLYHTGWPTTEVRAEQVQNPDGSSGILPILGPRNARRYSPYHRLDLKLTRRFVVGGATLSLYLEVTNLYGRRNVCCADGFNYLPQPDGGVRVERIDGTWLRQLPVAGLTWDF
jgi:outer membrane receptor protein involved in Fe transport